jgi:hypothetical protein
MTPTTRARIDAAIWAFMTAIAYPFAAYLLFGTWGIFVGWALGGGATWLRYRGRVS